jgi:hypothetical protein
VSFAPEAGLLQDAPSDAARRRHRSVVGPDTRAAAVDPASHETLSVTFQNAQRTLISLVTTESNMDSGAVDTPVVEADDARR